MPWTCRLILFWPSSRTGCVVVGHNHLLQLWGWLKGIYKDSFLVSLIHEIQFWQWTLRRRKTTEKFTEWVFHGSQETLVLDLFLNSCSVTFLWSFTPSRHRRYYHTRHESSLLGRAKQLNTYYCCNARLLHLRPQWGFLCFDFLSCLL